MRTPALRCPPPPSLPTLSTHRYDALLAVREGNGGVFPNDYVFHEVVRPLAAWVPLNLLCRDPVEALTSQMAGKNRLPDDTDAAMVRYMVDNFLGVHDISLDA